MAEVYDDVLADCDGGPAPSAAMVTRMVDETAKSIMRAQGRDPEMWDRLNANVRDELRLLALDRLRRLA